MDGAAAEQPNEPAKQVPSGIGGWLILPLIGLILTPIRTGHTLWTHFWPIFSNPDIWFILGNPASANYHPLWIPYLLLEVIGNTLIVAGALFALWLLLRKSRHTPRFVIAWYLFAVVIVMLDPLIGELIPAVAAESNAESFQEIARSVLAAAIWVPYFLKSERVKATFVK
jgi:hypothetical protein